MTGEYAWRFLKVLHVANTNGWNRFVTMQNHINLIYREEEREMLPLCREEKIGILPYSPLASGRLTRDRSEKTLRSETEHEQKTKYDAMAQADQAIVERVREVAEKHRVSRSQIALAWLLQKHSVTAPVVGATKASHIEEAVRALSLQLTPDDIAYLE